jgi:hypothetical protein
VCDETKDKCEQCVTNGDCSGVPGDPVCDPATGTCVACDGDTDCHDPGHPFCDTSDHQCVQCKTDGECNDGNFCNGTEACVAGSCTHPGNPCVAPQVCDETKDKCEQCVTNGDCSGVPGDPVCNPQTGTCVACDGDGDCHDPSHPFCSPGHTCVECRSDGECNDGNFCNGTEACVAGTCTHPGSPCAAPSVCDEGGDRCVQCTSDAQCTNPAAPVCDTGGGTCVQCNGDAQCDDGNVCNGGETCVAHTCHAGTLLGCDDGNPCTADSCNPGSGCLHAGVGDARDGSCETVTDSALCPIPDNTLRLIDLQNPTAGATGGVVQNDYLLNATNPGQAYYNVFYSGTPGSSLSLQINIPWPFVTNGDNPIQVHDGTGPQSVTLGDGACFAPTPALSGFTTSTTGGHLSNSGSPVILRGDYPFQNLGSSATVYVSGSVPATGLAYVTIHLDYGLKKMAGWQQGIDTTTLQGPDTNLDGVLDGLGSGVIHIKGGSPAQTNGQDYTFAASFGSSSTIYSVNAFKKNPGVNGLTLGSGGGPKSGLQVQFWGPNGNLIARTTTDGDGFYSFPYKHTGKPATYTVKVPDYKVQQMVTLKANGYALVTFEGLSDNLSLQPPASTWMKGMPTGTTTTP